MRQLVAALGALLSVIGLLLLVSPIPGATVMLALGIALLICSSTRAAGALQSLRTRIAWLNRSFSWLEDRAGQKIGAALKQTRPVDRS